MKFPIKLKKIDVLVLRSFIGPFLVTFILSLFLFLMQFLWKYIDELVGKGIPALVMLKLVFLSLADLVPMALPLTIMVAGLMTFGNLSESFELVAMKANGISLLRILRPTFVFMACLMILNFLFLNYVIPKANLEFKAMLMDMRSKKPAFNIDAGQFYQQIEGVSIRVGKKEADNETVEDVLIHEYKKDDSKRLNVIHAKKGKMVMSADKSRLDFTLFDGVRYEEMTTAPTYNKTMPFNQMFFAKQHMVIDLSSLDFKFTDREAMSHDFRLLNISQLQLEIDTFHMKMKQAYIDNQRYVSRFMHYIPAFPQMEKQRLIHKQNQYKNITDTQILNNFPKEQRSVIRAVAVSSARGLKGTLEGYSANQVFLTTDIALYRTEYHKKFAHSFLIFMLFLISAPLGAIIKKGGIGLPLVISVILFVLFYAINLTGEKMGKELVMPVWTGMWMSSMFLFPIGLWITYKAIRDSNAFTFGGFIPWIGKRFKQLFLSLKIKKA